MVKANNPTGCRINASDVGTFLSVAMRRGATRSDASGGVIRAGSPEAWELGGDDWERISAPATEYPRIAPKFLERERRNMAPMWFRQEYLAEFVDNGTSVFARDLIKAAIDPTIKPLEATLNLHTHS